MLTSPDGATERGNDMDARFTVEDAIESLRTLRQDGATAGSDEIRYKSDLNEWGKVNFGIDPGTMTDKEFEIFQEAESIEERRFQQDAAREFLSDSHTIHEFCEFFGYVSEEYLKTEVEDATGLEILASTSSGGDEIWPWKVNESFRYANRQRKEDGYEEVSSSQAYLLFNRLYEMSEFKSDIPSIYRVDFSDDPNTVLYYCEVQDVDKIAEWIEKAVLSCRVSRGGEVSWTVASALMG